MDTYRSGSSALWSCLGRNNECLIDGQWPAARSLRWRKCQAIISLTTVFSFVTVFLSRTLRVQIFTTWPLYTHITIGLCEVLYRKSCNLSVMKTNFLFDFFPLALFCILWWFFPLRYFVNFDGSGVALYLDVHFCRTRSIWHWPPCIRI